MPRVKIHMPFFKFLVEMGDCCQSDADVDELIDGIADTLGDMFAHQSDRYSSVARFVARLNAAAGRGAGYCALCNGMGAVMLDGSGAICPNCDGNGKEPAP